jgi:hypothetical protein
VFADGVTGGRARFEVLFPVVDDEVGVDAGIGASVVLVVEFCRKVEPDIEEIGLSVEEEIGLSVEEEMGMVDKVEVEGLDTGANVDE